VFLRQNMRDDELDAYAALSHCLLMQGKKAEAQGALRHGHAIYSSSQNQVKRLFFAIAEARVKAAESVDRKSAQSYREARSTLLKCLGAARSLGFVALEYEARLALGEMAKASDPGAKRYVTSLEKDARACGFELIARKAAALPSL